MDVSGCLDSETEVNFHDSDLIEGEQPGDMELEEDLCDGSDEPTTNLTNPMRKLVVTAVLDALKIKRDSGVSTGTFEDILQYAKKLLLEIIKCDHLNFRGIACFF